MDKWQDVMFQIISQTIIFVRILVSPRAPRTSKRLNEKCAILKIELRTFENHYRHVNGWESRDVTLNHMMPLNHTRVVIHNVSHSTGERHRRSSLKKVRNLKLKNAH